MGPLLETRRAVCSSSYFDSRAQSDLGLGEIEVDAVSSTKRKITRQRTEGHLNRDAIRRRTCERGG